MSQRGITNTSKLDPEVHLAKVMLMGSSESIVHSEAVGQQELVASTLLPVENTDRTVMEAWGIEFGEPLPDDPLFCEARLPAGWSRKETEHPMWSVVIDDKGHERAEIFYKAAFYDRRAFVRSRERFCVRVDYDFSEQYAGQLRYVVTCDDDVLHTEERRYEGGKYGVDYRVSENDAGSACEAWLNSHYPDHADPVKSWDIVLHT